jgi:hypothetical protein
MNNHSEIEKEEECNYRLLLVDDYDSDSDIDIDIDIDSNGDGPNIDTQWIVEYEQKILYDEYRLFLKTDVTTVTFEFYYLDHHRSCVEQIVPVKYSLKMANQISQHELFSIIRSYQHLDKKYYNFHSLLLYSFDFQDNKCKSIIQGLSQYIQGAGASAGAGAGAGAEFIEYTNLLSIDIIYLSPVITMFHDIIGFSVMLYED